MAHIANDKLHILATRLLQEAAMEPEDMIAMQHILGCEACSRKLKRASAIVDALDNISLVAALTKPAKKHVPEKETAIIQIVVLDARAILQQLHPAAEGWCFEESFGFGGLRSAGNSKSNVEKLEDIDNSRTFVSYDPGKKMLAIQVDGGEGIVPSGYIRTADGNVQPISFEKRGSVHWAEVHGLEPGSYELILEK